MLQDMKTSKTIQKLENQIAQIKSQLQRHGPMRPGSLSRQYNVCGKPGCWCKLTLCHHATATFPELICFDQHGSAPSASAFVRVVPGHFVPNVQMPAPVVGFHSPSFTKRWATSRPMPDPAPITTATCRASS